MVDETTTTEFVQVFKVLSDSTRFELLPPVDPRSVCRRSGPPFEHIGGSVSQHLKQLREAGLVKGENRGYWTHYAVEKDRLNGVAEALKGLTVLPRCPDGACMNQPNKKTDCRKEGTKMCDCNCQYPERLKGKPEECTPEQIRECHGDQEHPCGKEEGAKE